MDQALRKVAIAEPTVYTGQLHPSGELLASKTSWHDGIFHPIPQDEQERRHAFVATALFAAGITSLILTKGPRHEPNAGADPNPFVKSHPSTEKSAPKYSPTPASLVPPLPDLPSPLAARPIGIDGSSVDGLVPFLPGQSLQSPAPIPPQPRPPLAQIHDPIETPPSQPDNAPLDDAGRTAHEIIASVLDSAMKDPLRSHERMIEITKPKPHLQPLFCSNFTDQIGDCGFHIMQLPIISIQQGRHVPEARFSQIEVKLLPKDQEDFWEAVRLLEVRQNNTMSAAAQSLEEDFRRGDGFFVLTTYGKNQTLQFSNPSGRPGATHVEISKQQDGTYRITAEPLVFDLKGTGVRVSNRWVRYDITGKGRIERFHDIASTNGILVFDSDRSGVSGKNARELFGDKTDLEGTGRPDGYKDGFEALEALVRKGQREQVLPPDTLARGRLGPEDLSALGKAYGLGIRVGSLRNETISLKTAGVREIILSPNPSQLIENFDGQGDNVARRKDAVFVRNDGSTGSYEAVFFAYDPASLL